MFSSTALSHFLLTSRRNYLQKSNVGGVQVSAYELNVYPSPKNSVFRAVRHDPPTTCSEVLEVTVTTSNNKAQFHQELRFPYNERCNNSEYKFNKYVINLHRYISPITGQRCPKGSRELRFPDYVTVAQDGGKVVSLTHRPPLPQEILLVLISLRG